MNCQGHTIKHKTSHEYFNCQKNQIGTFVDDCFGIVKTNTKETLWKKIEEFIIMMNRYYTSNRLKNNVKKS